MASCGTSRGFVFMAPIASKTFQRKTDAQKWAQRTEVAMEYRCERPCLQSSCGTVNVAGVDPGTCAPLPTDGARAIDRISGYSARALR
jgi:hypothetical protein